MTKTEHYDSIQVFMGVDVGKGAHHAVAIDRAGQRLLDCALPNDERRLRLLIETLKAHGPLLVVVDQPATPLDCNRRGISCRPPVKPQ